MLVPNSSLFMYFIQDILGERGIESRTLDVWINTFNYLSYELLAKPKIFFSKRFKNIPLYNTKLNLSTSWTENKNDRDWFEKKNQKRKKMLVFAKMIKTKYIVPYIETSSNKLFEGYLLEYSMNFFSMI